MAGRDDINAENGRAALIKRPRDRCGRNAQDARFTKPIPFEPYGFVGFRVPRRRRFVSGEAAKPAGCGGEATTGETKSQAQTWLPRRNRRQAIRRFRPFSWSRASAKLSNFQTYHADGVRGRAYAPCHKNLYAPIPFLSVAKPAPLCGQTEWHL